MYIRGGDRYVTLINLPEKRTYRNPRCILNNYLKKKYLPVHYLTLATSLEPKLKLHKTQPNSSFILTTLADVIRMTRMLRKDTGRGSTKPRLRNCWVAQRKVFWMLRTKPKTISAGNLPKPMSTTRPTTTTTTTATNESKSPLNYFNYFNYLLFTKFY